MVDKILIYSYLDEKDLLVCYSPSYVLQPKAISVALNNKYPDDFLFSMIRRYGTSSSGGSELSRSRSTHALKSRETSPVRGAAGDDKDGAALSSWARYLKNKYGNRTSKDGRDTGASSSMASPSASSSSTPTAADRRRLSLGLPLRQANEVASSDDDSKNGLGSPTSPM